MPPLYATMAGSKSPPYISYTNEPAIRRLTQHKGIAKAQILTRLKAQMPAEEKMKYADEVIYNAGSLNQLEAKVSQLFHSLSP